MSLSVDPCPGERVQDGHDPFPFQLMQENDVVTSERSIEYNVAMSWVKYAVVRSSRGSRLENQVASELTVLAEDQICETEDFRVSGVVQV